MNLSLIPDEIKQLDQWVCCWQGSKIPMRGYERRAASPSQPDTWSSFEQAEWAVKEGHYDYLGFVFNDNGIVGIDIDDGFDEGLLTELGADIISRCESYTEKSRSGRGVHILLKGDLPFLGKNNRAGVEIYKSRRFFITTGDVVFFDTIIENQDAIDYVVETYFQDVRETSDKGRSDRIYNPVWQPPKQGKIFLEPVYPEIGQGGRNICLTSIAGQMHNAGYSQRQIYHKLLQINKDACQPMLDTNEVYNIANSITKYER